jgi:hypothetical protein
MSCDGPRGHKRRWIRQMKFTIGFKDDEMINDHKVIKRQLGRV